MRCPIVRHQCPGARRKSLGLGARTYLPTPRNQDSQCINVAVWAAEPTCTTNTQWTRSESIHWCTPAVVLVLLSTGCVFYLHIEKTATDPWIERWFHTSNRPMFDERRWHRSRTTTEGTRWKWRVGGSKWDELVGTVAIATCGGCWDHWWWKRSIWREELRTVVVHLAWSDSVVPTRLRWRCQAMIIDGKYSLWTQMCTLGWRNQIDR